MNKVKFLGIMVVGLMVLNILLIWFSFCKQDKGQEGREGQGRRRPEPREVIINELQFTDDQIDQYEMLIHAHRSEIDITQQKINAIRKQLYSRLAAPVSDSLGVELLTKELGQLQAHIETIHFHHFEDIRKLCKGNQIKLFDDFSTELNHLFAPPRRPH